VHFCGSVPAEVELKRVGWPHTLWLAVLTFLRCKIRALDEGLRCGCNLTKIASATVRSPSLMVRTSFKPGPTNNTRRQKTTSALVAQVFVSEDRQSACALLNS
jgi:hypothetical protein